MMFLNSFLITLYNIVFLQNSIRSKEHLTEAQEWLEASIRQVALDASLDALKKEIVSSEVVEYDDNDLQVLFTRIMKIKNEIVRLLNCLFI